MAIILSTQDKISTVGNAGDIERITLEMLGGGTAVVYEDNIPKCVELIRGNQVRGIITPWGHGEETTVWNLEKYLGPLQIPVFEAYKLGRSGWSGKEYRTWLSQNLLQNQ